MYLDHDKMRVAENCPEYKSSMPVISNLSNMSLNCASCINFQDGSCKQDLANKISSIININ